MGKFGDEKQLDESQKKMNNLLIDVDNLTAQYSYSDFVAKRRAIKCDIFLTWVFRVKNLCLLKVPVDVIY